MEQSATEEFLTARSFPEEGRSNNNVEASEIGEHHPSQVFESSQIDHLLETSFVELDRMINQKQKDELTNYSSGDQFFQKTGSLFLSSLGMRSKKKMKNKKVQCSIGQAQTSILLDVPETRNGKQRRLQFLKMIKLLRLIFKIIRFQRQQLKEETLKAQEEQKQFIDRMREKWGLIMEKWTVRQALKDSKIKQYQQLLEHLLKQNESLKGQIQSDSVKSSKRIKELEEQNWRSLTEINEELSANKHRLEDIHQKNQQLEQQVATLTQEINTLNDMLQSKETELHKLQYFNVQLQSQNKQLNGKWQQTYKKNLQNQCKYTDFDQHLQSNHAQLQQSLRLNDLYLKQIKSAQLQNKRLQEEQEQLKAETEDIINQQLRKYQEYFKEEIEKIKKEYSQNITQKNYLIEQQEIREQVYLSIINQKQQSNLPYSAQNLEQTPLRFEKASIYSPKRSQGHKQSSTTSLVNPKTGKQKGLTKEVSIKSKQEKENKSKIDPLAKTTKSMKNRSMDLNQQNDRKTTFKAQQHVKYQIKLASILNDRQEELLLEDNEKAEEDQNISTKLNLLNKEVNRNIKQFKTWKFGGH